MSWKRRVVLYLAVFAAVSVLIVGFILVAWAVPMGDFDTVHPVPPIAGIVGPLAAIPQKDGHTCGLLALSAIYRSYGLDPKERRLRQRLGVDTPAYIYDSTSTGCIHPDIYRVMTQDGFDLENIDLSGDGSLGRLERHLDSLGYALALIRRRGSGNLHWVVIGGRRGDQLEIHDSLADSVVEEPVAGYLRERVVGLILVSPATERPEPSVWRLHLAGAIDAWMAIRNGKR